MAEITIINDDTKVQASAAISILNTLLREGVPIDHRCGGKAQCGTCRIRIVEGQEHLSPVLEREDTKLEKFRSGNSDDGADLRLACQTYTFGDVSIEILSRRGSQSSDGV